MEGWDLRALAVLERLNAAGHRAVLVGRLRPGQADGPDAPRL